MTKDEQKIKKKQFFPIFPKKKTRQASVSDWLHSSPNFFPKREPPLNPFHPAKIQKACTAKPHRANIRSTLWNSWSFPRTVFICIRLTSAFSYPLVPSPCDARVKRGKKREREGMVESRRKRNVGSGWLKKDRLKKVHSFSSSSSSSLLSLLPPLSFPSFSFLLRLPPWQSTVLLRRTTKALFWLKPVSRLCEPNRPGCSWLGSRKDKGLLRNPRCA